MESKMCSLIVVTVIIASIPTSTQHGSPPPTIRLIHKSPPTHSTPACDVCSKVTTGFDYLLHKLKKIHDKVLYPCPSPDPHKGAHGKSSSKTDCPAGTETAYGELSATAARSESVATCRAGTVVVACDCSIKDETCHGVTSTETTCTAVKGDANTDVSIQAVAQCTRNSDAKFTRQTASGVTSPSLQCDPGYEVAACWLLNLSSNMDLVKTEIDTASDTCMTATACPSALSCTLTILCQAT